MILKKIPLPTPPLKILPTQTKRPKTAAKSRGKEFGGELLNKRRKSKRPLDPTKPTHFVLRLKQNLPHFFSPRNGRAKQGFFDLAGKYQIKVYHLVFNHSHCHACLMIPSQKAYVDFVRELTSRLTGHFSKLVQAKLKGIFLHRPFTRIVEWGRSFAALMKYFEKNILESGFSQPKPPPQFSTARSKHNPNSDSDLQTKVVKEKRISANQLDLFETQDL